MSHLQAMVVTWLTAAVALLPVGYAFGAGMVSAVNPCGFAMLPAYLSIYLGVDDRRQAHLTPMRKIGWGIVVGACVSSGFMLLFAVAGLIIAAGGSALMRVLPGLGWIIGLSLILLGIALLAGRSLSPAFFERWADRISKSGNRSYRAFFLFGLAYGIASLGCTLPVFLVVVGGAMTSRGFSSGVAQFVSYALGMGSVIVALTIALSLCKLGLVGNLRRALPYVRFAAALLLVIAGASIVIYWSPHISGMFQL